MPRSSIGVTAAAGHTGVFYEYLGNYFNDAAQAAYTANDFDIGAAAVDRLIAVVIAAQTGATGNITVDSVIIGGNAATIHAQKSNNGSPGFQAPVAIASLVMASGTTADIVVEFSETIGGCLFDVFDLRNYTSAMPADTDTTAQEGSGNLVQATVNVGTNGIVLAAHSRLNDEVTTWSGATEVSDHLISFFNRVSTAQKI